MQNPSMYAKTVGVHVQVHAAKYVHFMEKFNAKQK
jgi:hypothetical protein